MSAEWDKFNDAYGKLRLLAKQPSDMENFTSQYFERVRKLAEEHIEIFKNELNRLSITEHENPHAIQSSLEFPRTSSHTNPVDSNENIFGASPQAAIGKLSARMPALGRFISRVDHITSNENQEFYKVRINFINKLWNQVEELYDSAWDQMPNPLAAGLNQDNYDKLNDMVLETLSKLKVMSKQLNFIGEPNEHVNFSPNPEKINTKVRRRLQ